MCLIPAPHVEEAPTAEEEPAPVPVDEATPPGMTHKSSK